jgi:hypothetical protein
MRDSIRSPSLLVGLLLGVDFLAACGSTPGAEHVVPVESDDAGGVGATPPGAAQLEAGSSVDATPAPQSSLRVAHLSPDLPALDVCVAPHGTTNWQGPLVAQLSGADGGAPGIAYSQVSAYLSIAPGQSDVLIVPAGSTSCGASVADGGPAASNDGGSTGGPPDAQADAPSDASDAGSASEVQSFPILSGISNLPPLPPNALATLIIAGEVRPNGSDRALTFTVVSDDSQLAGGAASLRAVNAVSRGDALDIGLGSMATRWTPLFTSVQFGTFATQAGPSNGMVDVNGYLPVPSFSGETMSARLSTDAGGDMAVAKAITVPVGSIATIVAIGTSAGDAVHPPALLLCVDNQPSGGILSDCSLAR